MKSSPSSNNSAAKDDLIVDFPPGGRQISSSSELRDPTSGTNQVVHANLRRVRFSDVSSLRVTPHVANRDRKLLWNSTEDKIRFKQIIKADVLCMRDMFESDPSGTVSEDELCIFMGIEPFISRKAMKLSMIKKKRHVQAILVEQARQDAMDVFDEEALSLVSRVNSGKSRMLASKHASLYAAEEVDYLEVTMAFGIMAA